MYEGFTHLLCLFDSVCEKPSVGVRCQNNRSCIVGYTWLRYNLVLRVQELGNEVEWGIFQYSLSLLRRYPGFRSTFLHLLSLRLSWSVRQANWQRRERRAQAWEPGWNSPSIHIEKCTSNLFEFPPRQNISTIASDGRNARRNRSQKNQNVSIFFRLRLRLRRLRSAYDLVKTRLSLPACRRLLFPLLHAEKGRLRNAVANCVPASRWVPKILGTCCDRLTHSAHCLTWRWLVVIESGLIVYAVIYVIGAFQPKQIKTCAIVCRLFEILCEAAENLACARKLFLYNLLCMTHHFSNSLIIH